MSEVGLQRLLLAVGASLVMTGCVPAVTTYYQPTATSGIAINDACGTALAPADTIKFAQGTVDIRVTGRPDHVILTFRVPEGVEVGMISNNVVIATDAQTKTHAMREFGYYDQDTNLSRKVPAGKPLSGGESRHLFGSEPRVFQSVVELESSLEAYRISLPLMLVNGEPFPLPPITFAKKTGFGIYPVNC
jgi:hypothetical protein